MTSLLFEIKLVCWHVLLLLLSRKCVHQLEEDMKLLRDRQDQCEETAAEQNLQEQVRSLQRASPRRDVFTGRNVPP